MPLWLIPLIYTVGSVLGGLVLPRLEHVYLAAYTHDMAVGSALAFLSAVASGMMALSGIVFAIAFVMVQFSAIAYSPRLALWFARDNALFHALGVFVATFIYSLATLSWLVQRLGKLQIANVLQLIGGKGRAVIHDMFQRLDERPEREWKTGGTLD